MSVGQHEGSAAAGVAVEPPFWTASAALFGTTLAHQLAFHVRRLKRYAHLS